MHKCFFKLNFNDKVLLDNVDLYAEKKLQWQTIKIDPTKYLTAPAINFITNKLQLNLLHYANLFIGSANFLSDIHRDLNANFALNYVWGSKNSTMHWYETIQTKKNLAFTTAGTPYFKYSSDEVKEVSSVNLFDSLYFVKVDIPHQVKNSSNNVRYCLSLRFEDKIHWNEISTRYKNYINE